MGIRNVRLVVVGGKEGDWTVDAWFGTAAACRKVMVGWLKLRLGLPVVVQPSNGNGNECKMSARKENKRQTGVPLPLHRL